MNATAYTQEILDELQRTLSLMKEADAENLVDAILSAKKIFVAGGGRSGFMAKAFVMRMMHIGLEAYVVGETVTPNLEAEDLFIVGTGSGETGSLVAMTEKAKSIGATIAAVTTNPSSTIGKLADHTIEIPAQSKAHSASGISIQPMGSLFEQALLLFYDGLILCVMEKSDSHSDIMYGRHANLE